MRLPPTIEWIAFCLQQAPGVGTATLRKVLARFTKEGLSPKEFLGLDDQALLVRFGLKPPAIAALRDPVQVTVEMWQDLEAKSVRLLVGGQPGYPASLADLLQSTAPPILYALGNLGLFDRPSVGFCGSRKASAMGLQATQTLASMLAQHDIVVVSGYAGGVDLAAHRAALEAGGTTTLVLAEGILHFRSKSELRPFLNEDGLSRMLVVSEFPPGLAWLAHNAMTRNRTICGIARAMIVIESGLEGGTFEAGKTALELGRQLFCVEYEKPSPSAPGNPYFLQHGAVSLKPAPAGEQSFTMLLKAARSRVCPIDQPLEQKELLLNDGPNTASAT